MSKKSQVVVWGSHQAQLGQYLVDRRVVRVGAAVDADIRLDSPGMAETVLTLNFSNTDLSQATGYARAASVLTIGGNSAELNKGVPLSVGQRVELSDGFWLEFQLEAGKKKVAVPTPVAMPTSVAVGSPGISPSGAVPVTAKSQMSYAPLVALALALLLVVVVGAMIAGASGRDAQATAVTLDSLMEQLARTTDPELAKVREQVQLAWRVPPDSESFLRHVAAGRQMLQSRLGDKVWSGSVDMQPRTKLDQEFELQLYAKLSELLNR